MEGHRQRLIESGLLVPLSNEEIARRNGIIQQIAERKARGDKCRGVDIPEYCVFRADKPFCHIQLSGNRRCEDAEIIADKLFGYVKILSQLPQLSVTVSHSIVQG